MAEPSRTDSADPPAIRLPHELKPSPHWRPDSCLVFDAVNSGPHMADVVCRFVSDEAEMSVGLGLFPALPTRVVVPLEYLDSQRVIPGRTPHRFKCVCWGDPVDVGRLTRVELTCRATGGHADVRIGEPFVSDELPDEWPAAPHPVVGHLHQWAERDWPGKVRSLDAIRNRTAEEVLSTSSGLDDDLSRWGGWPARQFGSSGFFRVEQDKSRWWLVDPDGCAFYSLGADCVRSSCAVQTAGNEDLFADLPAKDGAFADLWSGRGDGEPTMFDALQHNMRRALGENWRVQWMDLCARRLPLWGFNTVGNWSDLDFCRFSAMPYVHQLRGFPVTERAIFRDFPDVFSDEYERNSRAFAEQLRDFADDRFLIGYFLRNEPHWAFGVFNLPEQMLLQDAPFASRDRLVEWLKERYGDVASLNAAWGTQFDGFERLASGALRPDDLTADAARADLGEFNRLMIERYVRVPSQECKRVDADHLNLGMRYAWIAHDDLLAGADVFDVFSINGYKDSPPADDIARCSKAAGAPVIVGEFHTGALDRGLPMGGLRTVRTQQDRADSYSYYVEQGAAIPELVGTHYFQWNDQHVAGRFDGENWQIGIVDICQQPYEEFVAAARRSHSRIYRVATGEMTPFDRLPPGIPIA